MAKIKLFFLVALSTLILSGCKQSLSLGKAKFDDHQIITASVGNATKLKLEVVNTTQSIGQGLSGRDELGVDGMLFIFNQPTTPQFWMKEMEFDLDLIWIKDMRVVEIIEEISAPNLDTPANQLPIYGPSQLVDMVLEVEAGSVQKWKLRIGDEVVLLQLQ